MSKAVVCILLVGLVLLSNATTVVAGATTRTALTRAGEVGQRGNNVAIRADGQGEGFAFVVTADMRNFAGAGEYDTAHYFRGAVEAIAALGGNAFMVTPGDDDPPDGALWTIQQVLGADYRWYPVVGNHELPNQGQEAYPGANLAWLNSYDHGSVNPGPTGCPQTTYSFDYGTAHFVMLDLYCDSTGQNTTAGDVPDHLYEWLENDLNSTAQEQIFVFGHEPAFPQPDADNGRIRHVGESLDQYPDDRDRFWDLLHTRGVAAYLCGHTHNYSAVEVNGVWQLDAGHARGLGDTGARSTFLVIRVASGMVTYETYRDDANGGLYAQRDGGRLWPGAVSMILHRDGALWSSDTGWEVNTPPFYPGTAYAKDLELLADRYLILHQDGAIYDSVSGWNVNTPPYYPGTEYAVELEVTASSEEIILHQDGALWSSDTGWTLTTPPYYPGTAYAKSLEVREDTSYVILHKEGAMYDSASGWVVTTPPYYPGTTWAVDLKFDASGYVLLHQDGAIYDSATGWITTTPPYYAGTAYARALALVGSSYKILHKDGAIYNAAVNGWDITTPPFYPGTNYAVDLEMY